MSPFLYILGPTGLNTHICLSELKHVPTGSKQQIEPALSTGSPSNTDYWQLGAKGGKLKFEWVHTCIIEYVVETKEENREMF